MIASFYQSCGPSMPEVSTSHASKARLFDSLMIPYLVILLKICGVTKISQVLLKTHFNTTT